MKKLCLLLAAFPMLASAIDEGNKSVAVESKFHYSVSPAIGVKEQTKNYYLIRSGETWSVSRSGDLSQDTVERVAVSLSTGVIYLDTKGPSRVSVGERERGPGRDNKWECFQGVILNGSGFRTASDYSICSSNLAKNVTTPGEAAIGSLNLLFGSVRRFMAVDQEQILAIAETSGLIDMIEQDRQAATGAEYHALFAAATTPGLINNFTAKYQANDPEGLVPQAQARMQQAEIEECRSNYLSATTPAKLNSFIAKYQGNDPESLVPRARKRLQDMEQAAAKNEADRLHRLENKQIGDQVCSSGDSVLKRPNGIVVMGQIGYRETAGHYRVVGFVEGASGKKIQIRISGINFAGEGISESTDSFSGWKGGSTLKINSIIWDSTYDWEGC
jgi:hypothetical protein